MSVQKQGLVTLQTRPKKKEGNVVSVSKCSKLKATKSLRKKNQVTFLISMLKTILVTERLMGSQLEDRTIDNSLLQKVVSSENVRSFTEI